MTVRAAATTGAKPRPGRLMRLVFAIPPLLYRTPLAGQLGPRMLLLTTLGRRTGALRRCALNYGLDGDVAYVASGFGRTGWLRNLLAHPRVRVQIGRETWPANARLVSDPDEARRALRLLRSQAARQGPPAALRPVFRLLGLDYEGEVTRMDDPGFAVPVVALERLPAPPPVA